MGGAEREPRQRSFAEVMRGRHPDAPWGRCRWCGTLIGNIRRRWHEQCKQEVLIRMSWGAMRDHVVERDGAACAACNFDAADMDWELRRQLQARGVFSREAPSLVRQAPLGQVLLDSGYDPRTSLWEVDHLRALADGGTGEPEWLWVLCQVCHKRKSAYEAALRAGKALRLHHAPFVLEKPAEHRAWWRAWLRDQAAVLSVGR